MEGDLQSPVWLGLGTSYRTFSAGNLRDEGVDLQTHLQTDAYHVQQATPAEVAQSGRVLDPNPAFRYVRLAQVVTTSIHALVFRIEADRVSAFNSGSDTFYGSVWTYLTGRGFLALDLGPAA